MQYKFIETAEGIMLQNSTIDISKRPEKGKSLIGFPRNFVVIDIETTGLFPEYDSIIEISSLKVRDLKVVDSFSSLIYREYPLDEFIVELTGITDEMLSTAPEIGEVLPKLKAFIGDDIILAHNASFDVNFLYDAFKDNLDVPLSNNYVDTVRLARRIVPELEHHRLSDIAAFYNIEVKNSHRALADCETTFSIYQELFFSLTKTSSISDFLTEIKMRAHSVYRYDLTQLTSGESIIDETNPLFEKYCVFTGTLEKMSRIQAAQMVVDMGGFCENTVTKKTNFLILGNYDYINTIKEGKSRKHKKAEAYRLQGCDIQIIPESVFYEMIEE